MLTPRHRPGVTALLVTGIVLGCTLAGSVAPAIAAGTPAGTVIRNIAIANYEDTSGNPLPPVESNEVMTVVAQVSGVDVSPETALHNVVAGSATVFLVQVTNTGNGSDLLPLTLSGIPGGWAAIIYNDLDDDGVLDGEEETAGNEVTTLSLNADQMAPVLMRVDAPAGAENGEAVTMTLTATSTFDGGVRDTGTYSANVTAAAISALKSVTPTDPKTGDVVTYTITGINEGSSTAFAVVYSDPLPTGVTYVPGSMRFGADAVTYDSATPLTDGADGDIGDFGSSAANAVTFQWGDSPGEQTAVVFFRVTVNAELPAGTVVTNTAVVSYESPQGIQAPAVDSTPGLFTVAASPLPVLSITSTAGSAEAGSSLPYPAAVANEGNATDTFDITSSSTAGLQLRIWMDVNGDGIAGTAGDFELTDTDADGDPDLGSLVPGASTELIFVVDVPSGVSDGTIDVTTIMVTSSNDPAVAATGILTTTLRAPVVTVSKSVDPAGTQPPGQVLTYTAIVANGGQGSATSVFFSDAIPTNTTYVPNSTLVDGVPKTDIEDGDNVELSNRTVVVDLGTIGPEGSHTIRFSVTID